MVPEERRPLVEPSLKRCAVASPCFPLLALTEAGGGEAADGSDRPSCLCIVCSVTLAVTFRRAGTLTEVAMLGVLSVDPALCRFFLFSCCSPFSSCFLKRSSYCSSFLFSLSDITTPSPVLVAVECVMGVISRLDGLLREEPETERLSALSSSCSPRVTASLLARLLLA